MNITAGDQYFRLELAPLYETELSIHAKNLFLNETSQMPVILADRALVIVVIFKKSISKKCTWILALIQSLLFLMSIWPRSNMEST